MYGRKVGSICANPKLYVDSNWSLRSNGPSIRHTTGYGIRNEYKVRQNSSPASSREKINQLKPAACSRTKRRKYFTDPGTKGYRITKLPTMLSRDFGKQVSSQPCCSKILRETRTPKLSSCSASSPLQAKLKKSGFGLQKTHLSPLALLSAGVNGGADRYNVFLHAVSVHVVQVANGASPLAQLCRRVNRRSVGVLVHQHAFFFHLIFFPHIHCGFCFLLFVLQFPKEQDGRHSDSGRY